jgi:hypothetical protein
MSTVRQFEAAMARRDRRRSRGALLGVFVVIPLGVVAVFAAMLVLAYLQDPASFLETFQGR